MTTIELIQQIFELCIIPLLGVLTTFLVKWINAKAVELEQKTNDEFAQKYINLIADTVRTCVIATNQTYVETLKAQGKFDEEAQKIAFQRTYENVLATLTENAKIYLATITDDIQTYLTQLIEQQVHQNK